jgi:type II secretion system protein I
MIHHPFQSPSVFRPPFQRNGFILLEILLSLSLVSVALVLLFKSFGMFVQAQESIQDYTQAVCLLENKLHELRYAPQEKTTAAINFDPPCERFQWQVFPGQLSEQGFRKVTALVLWKDGQAKKKLEMTTYIREEGHAQK